MDYFRAGRYSIELGKKTYVMGILNVTPDSFSDGGSYFEADKAAEHAILMQEQGADIIDIGAQSTRPGAAPISAQEEVERLAPVLELLKGKLDIPISVDTFYPETARFSLENRASIINDVSGTVNEQMAAVVKEYSAGWVIMHSGGGASNEDEYKVGVVQAVREFFEQSLKKAEGLSLPRERICLDIGIGFGKSHEDNLRLIRELKSVKIDGTALLVGASRKRLVGIAANEPNPKKRIAGTVAAHTLSIAGGADIIRAHDVPEAVQSARVAEAILYG